jgi:hypothetical protein
MDSWLHWICFFFKEWRPLDEGLAEQPESPFTVAPQREPDGVRSKASGVEGWQEPIAHPVDVCVGHTASPFFVLLGRRHEAGEQCEPVPTSGEQWGDSARKRDQGLICIVYNQGSDLKLSKIRHRSQKSGIITAPETKNQAFFQKWF